MFCLLFSPEDFCFSNRFLQWHIVRGHLILIEFLFFSKEHTQKSDEKYLSLFFPGFFILDFKCELSLYNSKCKFGLTSPSFLYWKVLCSRVNPYQCEHSYSLMLGLPPYVLFPESTVTHGFDFHFHVDGPPPSKTIYTSAEFPKIDFSLFAKWHIEWATADNLWWYQEA